MMRRSFVLAVAATACALLARATVSAQHAPSTDLVHEIETRLPAVLPKVVAWRRDIYEHPELSFEVASPGRWLRCAPTWTGCTSPNTWTCPSAVARAAYQGGETGVMHACGHDNHVAILMGAAEVLAGMKASLPGTVKFLFQPAEEGLGGAKAMIDAGALRDPVPNAVFGLHVWPTSVGSISVRAGPQLAAAGNFTIIIKGKQTHGSQPWSGVDPIVGSAQVILGLRTIASRQVNVACLPSVITVGQIQGGNRSNIIPDSVVLVGTLRTFDDVMRRDIGARIKRTAEDIAHSAGASATVTVDQGGLVLANDTVLTDRMLPTLRRAAGANGLRTLNPVMGSDAFPEFTRNIPGMFIMLGVTPRDRDPATVAANHSPLFFADEAALETGVRAMAGLAVDFLRGPTK